MSNESRCTIRCKMSQQKECECSCGGKFHGTLATVQQVELFVFSSSTKPTAATSVKGLREKKSPAFRQVVYRQCTWCDRAVEFVSGTGWVHTGGTQHIMECPHCNWQGNQPADPLTIETDVCPNCGVIGDLRDNHVAMPGRPMTYA